MTAPYDTLALRRRQSPGTLERGGEGWLRPESEGHFDQPESVRGGAARPSPITRVWAGRQSSRSNLAGALNNALGGAMEGRDPGDVAREIVRLAELPAGQRPLRTAMPATPAMDDNNAALATYQRQLLLSYGLQDLLPKTVG
jgi:hypothetical protein